MTDGPPEAACEAVADAASGLPLGTQEQAKAFCGTWFRQLLRIDPARLYAGLDVPALALFGALDGQVAAEPNAAAAEAAGTVEVRVVPGVNHLFQAAQTGAVSEYGAIEETMSPDVLALIADWIGETAR